MRVQLPFSAGGPRPIGATRRRACGRVRIRRNSQNTLTAVCDAVYFALQSQRGIMRDLDEALADITAIRSQMARGTEFHGYGPMTVAATGMLAVLAAGIQALLLPDPTADVFTYLVLWVMTAAICAILIGIEMVARTRRIHTGLADEMIQ